MPSLGTGLWDYEVIRLNLSGQDAAVVGLGISNLPLIKFLVQKGARVTVCDRQKAEQLGERYQQAAALGVNFTLGPDYLDRLADFDRIFLTPGIPKHLPEIVRARQRGAEISGEIDLVLHLLSAPVVAITGSAGKTTTTTLVGEMLKADGLQTYVGGNIGTPLILQAEAIPASATVVLELSSFQLHLVREQSPHISIVTNISPNHLDVHASMEEYIGAKGNILRWQKPGDFAVLNYADATVRSLAPLTRGQVVWFAIDQEPPDGNACFVRGDQLVWRFAGREYPLIRTNELKLLGRHNLANAAAASAAALLAGAGHAAVRHVLTTLSGVEHRLEPVRELDGVAYYNDSKATSPAETVAALETLTRPLVLIAGGYDKKLPFDPMAPLVVRKVHTLVLTGPTAPAIAAAVDEAARAAGVQPPRLVRAGNMQEALGAARSAARPGDAVLLSPACSSFDAYQNFEERGRHFKDLVMALA